MIQVTFGTALPTATHIMQQNVITPKADKSLKDPKEKLIWKVDYLLSCRNYTTIRAIISECTYRKDELPVAKWLDILDKHKYDAHTSEASLPAIAGLEFILNI